MRPPDFWKVKMTQSPIPESLHFFGSGLMGRQPLGDVALFLATSIEPNCLTLGPPRSNFSELIEPLLAAPCAASC
jgi:hypothetical protein